MRSILTALLVAATSAQAAININWGTTAGSTVSAASAPPPTGTPQTYFFLGAFASGFTPTLANRAEWLTNWTTVGSKNLFSGGFFNESSRLESNSGATAIGARAYVWGVAGNEWVLLTSDLWTWPNANNPINPTTPSFQISRSTTDATFGNISGDGTAVTFAVSNNAAPSITADRFLELFNQTDWAADPDNDGLTNLEEFALAGNPTSAASRPSLLVSRSVGDTQITLPKGTVDRVIVGFQGSDNLAQWIGGVSFTTSRFSNRDLLTISSTEHRRFFRASYTLR